MDPTTSQQVQQSLGQTQQQTQQIQQQIDSLMGSVQPMLQILLVVSVLATIAFILFYFMHMLHKWRVEKAILRIDKNLEKLVAAQVPVVAEEKPETDKSSDKNDIEQN